MSIYININGHLILFKDMGRTDVLPISLKALYNKDVEFEMNFEQFNQNKEISDLLSTCPLKILKSMEVLQFKRGEFYLKQEHYYKNVYIVVDGEFEIFFKDYNDKSILLAYYDKVGAFIGEQEALLNKTYSASVKNMTDCVLISIPNEMFLEWVRLDHLFSYNLLLNQCEQIYDLSHQTGFYTLHNIKEQVASYILSHEKITKKDIQRNVIASTRHVNRILSDLESKSLILITSGKITILDREKLKFYGEEKE